MTRERSMAASALGVRGAAPGGGAHRRGEVGRRSWAVATSILERAATSVVVLQ